MEDLSFLTINSLISISIPSVPSLIQAVMMKYIYFDILFTEHWNSEFMNSLGLDIENIEDDKSFSSQFSENGFESMQFLKNSGSSVIFLLLYVLSLTLYLMISLISKYWDR